MPAPTSPGTTLVAPAPPATAAKQRDPWFDNAKMALVVLVVIGHSWTLLPHDRFDDWTYDALYAWHVPAFVLVTGYLSKSFTWSRRRLLSLVTTVAVPYLVFEGLLALFRIYAGDEKLERLWANPHWPMWYLSALFLWRLMTPVFMRMPAKVVVAVAISLVAGLYAGDFLDLARVFGLLPFFVLGLKMHPGHWELLRSRRAQVFGVLTLVGIFVLARFTDTLIRTEWLYYRSRYDVLDTSDLRAATIRLSLLLIGLAGSFAFLSLVPRRKGWFTAMGSATLVVYLFHGFVVLGAGYLGYPGWAARHTGTAWVLTTLAAAGLALLLATPPVARRLGVVVDPLGAWRSWRTERATRRSEVPSSG